MNRFLSKLDLRDIKIDPRGSHFPPDEDAYADQAERDEPAAEPNGVEPAAAAEPSRQPYAPAWANAAAAEPASNGVETVQPERAEGEVGRNGDILKVSARSRPSAVAGAIAGVVRQDGRAEVQAIGAGATNQAIKAVAIAREYLKETGIEAVCLPAFIDVTIDNEDRTAIRIVVEPR